MNQLNPYQPSTAYPAEQDTAPTPAQTAGTQALQNLQQQAQAMGNAMQIAEAMCSTEMVPKHFRNKPADGAAAILYGAELGLNAIQSLQQIMVINGKPGIETRTAVALLKRHGHRIETLEATPESVTVQGTAPDGTTEQSTWTMDRAKRAGYTSNKLYQQIPEQMLYAKAAMEVARKIAPDVLSGIAYSTEELQLQPPIQATATRQDRPQERGADAVRAALAAKQTPEPQPEPAPAQDTDWIALIEQAEDHDALNLVMNQAQQAALPDTEYEQMALAANKRWEALSATAHKKGTN